jgi:hypothetical protein
MLLAIPLSVEAVAADGAAAGVGFVFVFVLFMTAFSFLPGGVAAARLRAFAPRSDELFVGVHEVAPASAAGDELDRHFGGTLEAATVKRRSRQRRALGGAPCPPKVPPKVRVARARALARRHARVPRGAPAFRAARSRSTQHARVPRSTPAFHAARPRSAQHARVPRSTPAFHAARPRSAQHARVPRGARAFRAARVNRRGLQ